MNAMETDPGWYERMAQRAAARRPVPEVAEVTTLPDRSTWPVPRELQGYSARDVFLWYICDGWAKIFGDEPEVETLFDHDFGYHVLRKGMWQLTLVNTDQFPSHAFATEDGEGR